MSLERESVFINMKEAIKQHTCSRCIRWTGKWRRNQGSFKWILAVLKKIWYLSLQCL